MRIPCPFCGERDLVEFTYLGDGNAGRPVPSGADASVKLFEGVYLRDNPAGLHLELWFHGAGCGSWLRATRDTRTHEFFSVEYARQAFGS